MHNFRAQVRSLALPLQTISQCKVPIVLYCSSDDGVCLGYLYKCRLKLKGRNEPSFGSFFLKSNPIGYEPKTEMPHGSNRI